MRLGRIVDWDAVVFPAWQRAAKTAKPNSDIWGVLPKHVLWFEAVIEHGDIERMYVIASEDWKDAFGTFRLKQLISAPFIGKSDPANHVTRIQSVLRGIDAAQTFEFPIMVTDAGQGPIVIVEGNHRTIAFLMRGLLTGKRAYVGFHARMATDFLWFRSAAPRKLTIRVNSKMSEK